jgi:hypothetical protein
VILLVLSAAGLLLGATNVGAERCKLCHRDIYRSWAATPHANAAPSDFEERCLACHATEVGKLPAVQCEACHGPGSDYAQPEVMIDPEKAAMAAWSALGRRLRALSRERRAGPSGNAGHAGAERVAAHDP